MFFCYKIVIKMLMNIFVSLNVVPSSITVSLVPDQHTYRAKMAPIVLAETWCMSWFIHELYMNTNMLLVKI